MSDKEKVLDILLTKEVNIRYLCYCISKRRGMRYYNASRPEHQQLTYEEWTLIKDILQTKGTNK